MFIPLMFVGLFIFVVGFVAGYIVGSTKLPERTPKVKPPRDDRP
jgi:hypothetical protein